MRPKYTCGLLLGYWDFSVLFWKPAVLMLVESLETAVFKSILDFLFSFCDLTWCHYCTHIDDTSMHQLS